VTESTPTLTIAREAEDAREVADQEDPEGLRFDDPEWDDEYCTWLDNGLRTCCG